MRTLAAEAFGTFCLVFAGTGAVVVNDAHGGVVTHVGVALTFGLVVLAMIYTLGDVSGCHLNPAVTLGFVAAGRFGPRRAMPYILAQVVGAVAASLALRAMFSAHPTLGATLPAGTAVQSWVMEFVLTLMLMVVILSVSTGAKEKGVLAGVAVGAVIALEAMFAGPVSGASMNPARSLAPAVVTRRLDHLWVYLTAPVAGALAGVLVCSVIHGPNGCCGPDGAKECTVTLKEQIMILDDFVRVLNENQAAALHLMLPDGSFVPAHYHVTEVGRVHKDFIDCGGTTRSTTSCVLQVWVAGDTDHRLDTTKLAMIVRLAAPLLKATDLPVEVEYENGVVSQFPVTAAEVTPSGVLLHLGTKHTACLAMDRCGVGATDAACCTTPGCC